MNTYYSFFFFFNDTATTEIYTLSLHDALPISIVIGAHRVKVAEKSRVAARGLADLNEVFIPQAGWIRTRADGDRKSTRLNSSHGYISYAVFCLKKKNTI